jgi:predicted nucleotidyltransferase
LKHLSATEQDCVHRYIELLRARLAHNLIEIRLFGSAARGDMWPSHFPMHSDIDLLILTDETLSEEVQEELLNETYPLFLECGRQIGPQFRTLTEFENPRDERESKFRANVETEGVVLYKG